MIDRNAILSDKDFSASLLERFLRYVRVDSGSDRHQEATPSTARQWDMIRLLEAELRGLGLHDLSVSAEGYIIARLPASPGREGAPCIGLMAHVDTASDAPNEGVKPQVWTNCDGVAIRLPSGPIIGADAFPDLADHSGDTIVSSDGSTLLGADDKAGVAEIMEVARHLQAHPELPHGPLELIFTPDEETGKGLPGFRTDWLRSKACYTMDGGKLGEVEFECFNAWQVKAEITGKVIHLGSARGKLANAVSMAGQFIAALPRSESPEATDGWHGYYCPLGIKGELDKAEVELFLRDFSLEGMERRIEAVKAMARAIELSHPGGLISLTFTKQYLNMREEMEKAPEVLEKLWEACRRAGVEPVSTPIRGGTDGARLTEMGIPTPNVFTGSYNFHSLTEWASLSDMILACRTLLHLVLLWGETDASSPIA